MEVGDFRATSLNTLIHMVAAGVGMTLLPAMAIDQEVGITNEVGLIRVVKDSPGRIIGLAWRKGMTRLEDFELVAQHCQMHRPDGTRDLASEHQHDK